MAFLIHEILSQMKHPTATESLISEVYQFRLHGIDVWQRQYMIGQPQSLPPPAAPTR
jgi:hypothetical protein